MLFNKTTKFLSSVLLQSQKKNVNKLNLRNYAKKKGTATKQAESATFEFNDAFKTYNLDEAPSTTAEVTKEELLKLFEEMTLIRRIEIASDSLYKQKLIRGFLHLYNGQEAICVGTEAAIRPSDHIVTAYRDHGFQICRGDTPRSVFGEMLGKITGCSKGNGGSMHMYLPEKNFHGGNGIVGAQVPIGAGLAFAEQYKGTDNVALAFYGDGAANQGQIYEAYNMASIWKLPALFICENNLYGMGTSAERATSGLEFYQRGYYIPGLWIDGMDVLAVKNGIEFAAEHCRSGKGPLVLEMETYRYVGHSMSDPGTTYRTRDEVQNVRKTRDPITKTKERLIESGLATEQELKSIEKDIRKQVAEAEKQARSDPVPPPKQLYENVLINHSSYESGVRAVELDNSYKF